MSLWSKTMAIAGGAGLICLLAACEKPEATRGGARVDFEREAGIDSSEGERGENESRDGGRVTPSGRSSAGDGAVSMTLPMERVLRDNQGRELDATVIGRNSLNLTVVRRADQARFDVAIDTLSVEDQVWARSLAFQAAPVERDPGAEFAAEIEEPAYVKSRREQIIRLEERLRRLSAELKTSDNATLNRTRRARIKDAKDEIAELKSDIEIYEARLDNDGLKAD